ncbi:hypothetical protein CVS40_11867 [Lucilia cuprina]|nr:hypothetical protein CVS40_11867 [Lucilia cuprina]
MPEISQEFTPGSAAAEHTIFNGFIKREKSAFKNRIITLSYNINNEQCLIPEILLKKAGREFMEEVYKFLKPNIGLKFNVELHALYAKPNLDDLENTPLDVKSFQTKMKEIFDISEFEVKVTNNIDFTKNGGVSGKRRWLDFSTINKSCSKYKQVSTTEGFILYITTQKIVNEERMCKFNLETKANRTSIYKVNILSKNINLKGYCLNFNGLRFPLKIKDITIFEENNPCIILGLIPSISRLIRNQQTKRKEKVFVCDDCLQHFHLIEKLIAHQKNCGQKVSYVPENDKSTLEFQNYCNSMDVPLLVYDDSECIFENIQTCIPNMDSSSTTLVDKHIPYAFSYYIKGGIVQCSQRHSVANNKYLSDYKDKLPSKYLTYLDANNLYGWAMSQSLPECDFEWIEDIRNFSFESIPIDSDTVYILEVDLIYPIEIHDSHNNLPFCCENKAPPNSKEKKLIKNFFKLLNNAVYGKTMENVDKRKNIKIVCKWENEGKRLGARALIAKPEFNSVSIFEENMLAIELNKTYSFYNKLIYLGFTIPELSKWKMYDFHYDYIVPKYNSKALNYMDIDSFIYTTETDDFYKDIINDIDSSFDTSEYE